MRVLHFEYSDFFRKVVHDMALRLGIDYMESNAGSNLFKLLSKNDVDVIITGMELSDMSVETLLSELRDSKYKSLPVIILTSSDVENITKRLRNLIFTDFILKENLTPDLFHKTIIQVVHRNSP